MPAGSIITGGGITRAITIWRRQGGRAAGWDAARREIARVWPGADSRSIDTVIDYAQQAIASARRYNIGNPSFIPPDDVLPDARRIIRDDPTRPLRRPDGTLPPKSYCYTTRQDAISGADALHGATQFSLPIQSDRPLSKAELETLGAAAGAALAAKIGQSPPYSEVVFSTTVTSAYLCYEGTLPGS